MLGVRIFRKRHPPVGSRPGTLAIDRDAEPTRIGVVRYDARELEERDPGGDLRTEELAALRAAGGTLWVDVQGLGDGEALKRLAREFEIHPLALEDLVNVPQRPKCESYPGQLLFVCRHLVRSGDEGLDARQVSVLLGEGWLLTVQELSGELLAPVRRRLHEAVGPMRGAGSDYLAYAVVDTVVDGYFPVLSAVGEEIEDMEADLLTAGREEDMGFFERLRRLKRELVELRRAVHPLRDAVRGLTQGRSEAAIGEEARIHLRDTWDHLAQSADVIDSYRDLADSLLSTYVSVVGHRTNEIMKVLTIMASIFIPLTFLAGIYGMNFEAMPELDASWGYPLVLAAMLAIAVAMLVYFKRKGWLGGGRR